MLRRVAHIAKNNFSQTNKHTFNTGTQIYTHVQYLPCGQMICSLVPA